MRCYHYRVHGIGGQGQTWAVTGIVEIDCEKRSFAVVPQFVIENAFEKLTHGKAVYGSPGLGCVGPYRITRLLVEEASAAAASGLSFGEAALIAFDEAASRVRAEAAYQDDSFEPRICDRCGREYRGPAVYCSLACALADA